MLNCIFYKGGQNNVRFAFSVGDTTHAVYNKYQTRQLGIGDTNSTIFDCYMFSVYNT